MNWKFNKKKEAERLAQIEADRKLNEEIAATNGKIVDFGLRFDVSKKNRQYQETYDELERIYAEVAKEAGGVPDYGRGPAPKPYEWKPYKQEYPAADFEAQRKYDEFVKRMVGSNEEPGPARPAQPAEPAGVTLEELFAQDEAEDGETL